MKIKTIIADDHSIFRDGMKLLIESMDEIDIIGEASNGFEIIDLLKTNKVDLILTDIKMPKMDGIDAVEIIKKDNKFIKVIGITSFDDADILEKTIKAGFDGLLIKEATSEEIKTAIKQVNKGANYFSKKILSMLVSKVNDPGHSSAKEYQISKRENEILTLLCKGLARREIAKQLFISEKTVDKHKENLLKKTQTKNAVDLAIFAYKNHLFKS